MARTVAQEFYAAATSASSHDGGWGTDVDAFIETATSENNSAVCSHPNSAGTTTITVDPYSSRSTQGDSSNSFGWAWNAIGASQFSFGSLATAKRVIPAGTWQFRLGVDIPAGGTVTGSHSVVPTAVVYRVGPAPGYTRTELFRSSAPAQAGGILGVTAANFAWSPTQPEYVFEEGETCHVGFLTTNTQTAGLFGATTAGTLVVGVNNAGGLLVRTPPPGIRTQYFRDFDADGEGYAEQQPKSIVKGVAEASGEGSGSMERSWSAFRQFDAAGESEQVLDKSLSLSMPALGCGDASEMLVVIKAAVTANAVGQASRTLLAMKSVDAAGIGAAQFDREWQAYRQFDATGEGAGEIDRVVTFVRQFDAAGTGEISSFRLCLDADELPNPEGGVITNTYVFAVLD